MDSKRLKKWCNVYEVPPGFISKFSNAAQDLCGKGDVLLGKTWRAMKKEDIPFKPNFISVRIGKGQSCFGNKLSPFNVYVESKGSYTNGDGFPNMVPMELSWQASKVKEIEVDSNGKAKKTFFLRRDEIYQKGIAKRRYFTKNHKVAGAVFGNDPTLVSYVESRVEYCSLYAKAIKDLPQFQMLAQLVDIGFSLILLGPDAYPLKENETWQAAYENPKIPFGHERVIACMLITQPETWPWTMMM
jgi:hypothetical protein